MKSLRVTWTGIVAVSLLAVASVRGGEEGKTECCSKKGECSSKQTAKGTCEKGACPLAAAKTSPVTGGAATESFAIELNLDFGNESAQGECAEGDCCKKACACTAKAGEKKTAAAKVGKTCEKVCEAKLAAADTCPCSQSVAQACTAKAACQANACLSGKDCATGCCSKTNACESAVAAGEKCATPRDSETAKALIELMDRLGPSALAGSEFECVVPPCSLTAEHSERPLSLRDQLVEHFKQLEAQDCQARCEEVGLGREIHPVRSVRSVQSYMATCVKQDGASCAEHETSVRLLREAAESMEHTAAQLERQNLYEPADATRELAANLRMEGRRLQQALPVGTTEIEECQSVACPPMVSPNCGPTFGFPLPPPPASEVTAAPVGFFCNFGVEDAPQPGDELKALVEELRALREALGRDRDESRRR